MVLYRKYRPQKFSSVVGQEHIKRTLMNSLAGKTYSHGYLFAGPRGSGKTTLARIFAKALNCDGRKLAKDSVEPCNKCISCQEISAGRSMDVIEIDAASNRGIDEIRELREKIRFAPTKSAYKIYIIDEVHMLTKEAFNALLKTLEEPPSHAVFILATTEPHKILPTILSRVQRFDFHKATTQEISILLKKVAVAEKINIDHQAMELLASVSFGAYRDALSLLDQVSSVASKGHKITLEHVQEVLGLAKEESIFELIEGLADKNQKKLYSLISKLYYQGVDLENFTLNLIEILRKMALFKVGEDQLFDLTKEQQERLKKLAEGFETAEIIKLIEKFIACIPRIKSGNLPQLPLEMVVFEVTNRDVSAEGELLTSSHPIRPTRPLPDRLAPASQSRHASSNPERDLDRHFAQSPPSASSKSSKNFDKSLWPQIIQDAKVHNNSLAAMLKDAAVAAVEDQTITLAFKFKFHAGVIASKKNTQIIEEIIEKKTGSRYILSCTVDPELVIKVPEDNETQLLNGVSEVFEVEE